MTIDTTTCVRCGTARADHSYVVLYGDWDPDRDGFTRPPGVRPLCESCWRAHYDKVPGAHYQLRDISDAERVLDILAASDGRLAADCLGLFVGARPFVRVVDGEVRGIKPVITHEDGDRVSTTSVERIDIDREQLLDVFTAERGAPHDAVVILRPVEDTPFGDVVERGDDSHQLSEFGGGRGE